MRFYQVGPIYMDNLNLIDPIQNTTSTQHKDGNITQQNCYTRNDEEKHLKKIIEVYMLNGQANLHKKLN